MDAFLVGAQLVLAAIFGVAGAAKLFDWRASQRAVADFGVPRPAASVIGIALPLAELGIAVALLFQPTARWGALAAMVLLLTFVAGVANAMRQDKDVDCGCFGRVYSATAGSATLVRNAGLAALAAVVAWQGPAPPIDDWVAARTAAELIAVALTTVALVVAAICLILWTQNRRLQRELGETAPPLAVVQVTPHKA